MNEQIYQNITRTILENFNLKEFSLEQKKDHGIFRRRSLFSFNRLIKKLTWLLKKLKLSNPYLVRQSILGEVPFTLNTNDLLATELDLTSYSFAKMMPIKSIDLNARNKYLIKQKLNFVLQFHLQVLYDIQLRKQESNSDFRSVIVDDQKESLVCDPLIYLNQLNNLLNDIKKDEYSHYLRNLFYQDLYSLEFINLKNKDREIEQFNENNSEEQNKMIKEALETAVESDCYYKIFKSILHTNQISNSTLNDEICLFTTNWIYLRSILQSLKDEISLFVQKTKTSKSNQPDHRLNDHQFESLFKINDDYLLFSDLDEQKTKLTRNNKRVQLFNFDLLTEPIYNLINSANENEDVYNLIGRFMNKNHNVFEFYLNELNFLTIDLTRDLILFLVDNIEEQNVQYNQANSVVEQEEDDELLPTFQLLMFDISSKKECENKFTINLNINLTNPSNSKFINQLKTKLQSFINQLYHRKLLKKHLLSLNHEPDVEAYLLSIWSSIRKIVNNLNNVDQSFLSEIFLGNKRNLQNASSFIARKYLYFLIRNLFEVVYLVCSTVYDRYPVRIVNELNRNKLKLDNLIDQAFLMHLKDEILIRLLDADPIFFQINQKPDFNLTKCTNQQITRDNVLEIMSQLILLIRVKLLTCNFYSSPLYSELVKINEKFKNADDYFEKQMNVNLFKILNSDRKSGLIKDPTKVVTDIIENEILKRYLILTPNLECIEKVGEIGSQICENILIKKPKVHHLSFM